MKKKNREKIYWVVMDQSGVDASPFMQQMTTTEIKQQFSGWNAHSIAIFEGNLVKGFDSPLGVSRL